MVDALKEASVAEIAEFLKASRNDEKPVNLLLGQRAGALFEGNLYNTCINALSSTNVTTYLKAETLSPDRFNNLKMHMTSFVDLSPLNRFHSCRVVLENHFSIPGINYILVNTIKPVRARKEDELLMRLFKDSFLSTILTTNIDALLEDASDFQGMEKGKDYQLVINSLNDAIVQAQSGSIDKRLLKIYGDLDSLNYHTVKQEFRLDELAQINPQLKDETVKLLQGDIIILGYDYEWDKGIGAALQEHGGKIWYVNEEIPIGVHMNTILTNRKGKLLCNAQGNYKLFLAELYKQLYPTDMDTLEVVSLEATETITLSSAQMPVRNRGFISYSHKNKRQLEALQTYIRGIQNYPDVLDYCPVWDDTQIPPGENWKEEIEIALARAKVAVLLLSSNFFDSSFIRLYEIPALIKAKEAGEIQLLLVMLNPCDTAFDNSELKKYQLIHDRKKPLAKMQVVEREVIWDKLAGLLAQALKNDK